MTPSIRSASRGSARSALSASRRQLRTRFTTQLESACATYRLLSISYDCKGRPVEITNQSQHPTCEACVVGVRFEGEDAIGNAGEGVGEEPNICTDVQAIPPCGIRFAQG